MKNVLKALVILLLLFCFLFLVPSATHVGWAEIIEIPMDAETKLTKVPDSIPFPQESGDQVEIPFRGGEQAALDRADEHGHQHRPADQADNAAELHAHKHAHQALQG